MLLKSFALGLSLEVLLVVDIVVRVFWIPVGVTELILFKQVFLGTPHFFAAVWVFRRGEWSGIFWDVHLILSHKVVNTRVHLVLEEGVWHTQVVVWVCSNG
jgi:hypothetical protein